MPADGGLVVVIVAVIAGRRRVSGQADCIRNGDGQHPGPLKVKLSDRLPEELVEPFSAEFAVPEKLDEEANALENVVPASALVCAVSVQLLTDFELVSYRPGAEAYELSDSF
jgi:hypothetical protein